MSARAVQVAVVLGVAGVGALLWQRVAVDEEGLADSVTEELGSLAMQTTWGEADLSGVWQSVALGAESAANLPALQTAVEELIEAGEYPPSLRAALRVTDSRTGDSE